MEDIFNKRYKYLVVSGCSQTVGQNCEWNETWPVKLSKKLGLELINLASTGSGWSHVENSIMSFVHNNKEIVNECFFIFQISQLDRRTEVNEIPRVRTDIWEKWNIKFLSRIAVIAKGFIDWEKYYWPESKPENWDNSYPQYTSVFCDESEINDNLTQIPEHRHYPNSRNHWYIGETHSIYPPYIDDQFQEQMIYWGRRFNSFHLFCKNIGLDHIIVDGYSPFMSHELIFKNYYENESEFNHIKSFWSNNPMEYDEDEIMLYDFKNIKGKWLYDLIDEKYKITNTILWNAYLNQCGDEWSPDGGHAGPKGMDRIVDMLYDNLTNKGWFDEIYN